MFGCYELGEGRVLENATHSNSRGASAGSMSNFQWRA